MDIKELSYNKSKQAKELLISAYNSKDNSTLIKKSFELYYESLNLYSDNLESILGLSYISLISNELDKAIQLAKMVLNIEPRNIIAIDIIQHANNNKNKSPIENVNSFDFSKNFSRKVTVSVSKNFFNTIKNAC